MPRTRIPTEVEIDLNELELEFLERWASGASGPCPVCNAEVNAGADCPAQHYNQARGLTDAAGRTMSLAKAVHTLRARP